MTEIELKFQVPANSRDAVEAAVMTADGKQTPLQAIYFDTADRRLAAAGIAVRLRKEGQVWVQTVKAGGIHAMERLEHNVPLVDIAAGKLPALDLHRHAGSPAAALLAEALAPRGSEAAPEVVALYRTDILRSHRLHRTRAGVVELAFDEGAILAEDRRWPVCELEIELVSGTTAAVIEVAQRWVQQHGLWLDVRSKAERGDRLARNAHVTPPYKATHPTLRPDMSPDEALRTLVASGLSHILPNASVVASGEPSDSHLHQLRVGLRRLCAALDLFGGGAASVDPIWYTTLSALRRTLGPMRDQALWAGMLRPLLAQAGVPGHSPPGVADTTGAGVLVRDGKVMKSLLGLQKFVSDPPAESPDPSSLVEAVSDRLEHWHKQLRRETARPGELDESGRHALRRRVRRLRYAIELTSSLYARKKLGRYLARLVDLQDALGRSHDARGAEQAARELLRDEPRAWFAVGWLSAQHKGLDADSLDAIQRFRKGAPSWRHGK